MYHSKSILRIPRGAVAAAWLAGILGAFCFFGFSGGDHAKVFEPDQVKRVEIRGIYGNPNLFWKRGLSLDQLGVNAVFVHSQSIDTELMVRARSEGLKVFAEFATLNGRNYVEDHPEAWPVDQYGNRAEPASWFMGVCPTEPGFKRYRLEELRQLLRDFDLDGLWMDYFHWHAQFEEPEPILPETCFNDHCLSAFQAASGIEVPGGSTEVRARWILQNHDSAWRNWRCGILNDWALDIRSVVKQERPKALLGLYHCPWDDDDFGGARRRNLGLDYELLRETIDVFSPMVYHARMGRSPQWVKQNIDWLCQRLDIKAETFPKVWPIVQSQNDPYPISATEFEKVLGYGLSAEASGIMMFTANSVADDEAKTMAMKKIYMQLLGE